MMDSPVLSDDERRILLEYRITMVPTRRPNKDQTKQSRQQQQTETQSQQSCSSASSSTSSGSSSSNNDVAFVEKKRQANQTDSQSIQQHLHINQQPPETTQLDKQLPLQRSKSHSPQLHVYHHQANTRNNHHHHNLSHKHHDHHQNHHHNRKHKSTTPIPELTPDELNKMLELASRISYLKLVSPMRSTEGSQTATKTNHQQLLEQQNCNKNLSVEDNNQTNNENNNSNHKAFSQSLNINCNHNSLAMSEGSHGIVTRQFMFEKVDYIKKISNRRKALKRLKRLKNKSCSISPPSVDSAKSLVDS